MRAEERDNNNRAIDPNPQRIKREIKAKVKRLYVAFAIVSLFIVAQIALTQWGPNGTPLRNLSESKSYTTKKIEGSSGSIYDLNGKTLYTDSRGYRIRLDLHAQALTDSIFTANLPALGDSLAKMFGGSPKKYRDFMTNTRDTCMRRLAKPYYSRPFVTSRALNQWEYERLRTFPLMHPRYGLIVEQTSLRHKVHGSLASYTITRGIENAWQKELNASDGSNRFLWLDARHRHSVPIVAKENTPAINGSDIHTTIDIDLQEIVEGALSRSLLENGATDGTAIVLETSTGEIRAMANLTHHKGGKTIDDNNYATMWQGSPGSTFKAISLMTLIDEAGVSIDKWVNCGDDDTYYVGKLRIRDTHIVGENESGRTTLKGIFAESSNIGFVKTVMETYEEEPERWVEYINAIGLDKVSHIQRIGGYTFAGIKHPSSYKKRGGWSATTLPQTAYGYEIDMTPLQILMFYNAVANGGKLITPIIVKSITRDGEIVEEYTTEVVNPAICKPSTLEALKECMEAVVLSPRGTGKSLKDLPFRVAGKTGTAQVMLPRNMWGETAYVTPDGRNEYLATFVGYFPADNPKYTGLVSIKTLRKWNEWQKKYTGAGLSLPVFREIAEYIYAHEEEWYRDAEVGIAPPPKAKPSVGVAAAAPQSKSHKAKSDSTAKSEEEMEQTIPDVRGLGLRDALYELERRGCKVSSEGRGTVCEQHIEEHNGRVEVHLKLE
ncbi:MAG: transpeptidase family protein [Tidjanibacter sp.]|nr:transpeptidase family protein [Tidjanibacter sp.]